MSGLLATVDRVLRGRTKFHIGQPVWFVRKKLDKRSPCGTDFFMYVEPAPIIVQSIIVQVRRTAIGVQRCEWYWEGPYIYHEQILFKSRSEAQKWCDKINAESRDERFEHEIIRMGEDSFIFNAINSYPVFPCVR